MEEIKPLTDTQQIKFIENPLPGPKPHVKKQMNYDYEVPEDKMHYDIEEPERMYYDIT